MLLDDVDVDDDDDDRDVVDEFDDDVDDVDDDNDYPQLHRLYVEVLYTVQHRLGAACPRFLQSSFVHHHPCQLCPRFSKS